MPHVQRTILTTSPRSIAVLLCSPTCAKLGGAQPTRLWLRRPCSTIAIARHSPFVVRTPNASETRVPSTSPPPLRIYVCGRLAVEAGSVVVREADFPARQGRRLWAYLVLNRRLPVGRADLAEAVWGED